MAFRFPRINDITTDFERPPLYWVQPPKEPGYDAQRFRAKTERAYGTLKNLALPLAPEAAYRMVLDRMWNWGWNIAAQDDARRRVQAVVITPILRFRDDVVVEVRPGSDEGSCIIAMRSKSRLGKSDFGANAKRIRAFLWDLERG
jgi:hypothetical protein